MTTLNLNDLANLLIEYRILYNLTQLEMSSILIMPVDEYIKIECCEVIPSIDHTNKILKAIGKSIDDIKSNYNNEFVFTKFRCEARNNIELETYDRLIKSILCIEKHKNISEGFYGN